MIYFIAPIILILYFEFLGRWVAFKFKISHQFYFPLGFFVTIAITYPSLLLTINNVSFFLITAIYLLLFIFSLFLIIKDFKYIDSKINYLYLFLLMVVSALFTYYSLNTSLGNLNGFDTLYYLNFVTNNIGKDVLNSSGVYLNGSLEFSLTYYTGQTYYYFVSVIIYLVGKIASFFKVEYFYGTAYIWIFQIIFNFLFSDIICEIFSRSKNKLIVAVPVVFNIFFVGKLYFNNVYGFFGNSLLMITLSFATLYLIEYLNNKDIKYRYLTYVMLLAACSLSSSGIFISLFFLFGLYFFSYKDNSLLMEYSIVLFFPIINLLNMERKPLYMVYLIPVLISLILFFIRKLTIKIINNNKYIYGLLIMCFISVFIISRFYSDNLFDFHGLLNNLSQTADMTLDYFHFNFGTTLEKIYKIFVIVTLSLSLVFDYKKPFIMYCWILIIVFFNPFCCNAINDIIDVYYRAYIIIINPFTLVFMYNSLINRIRSKAVSYLINVVILIFVFINIDMLNPIYYHYEHKPNNDYNNIYKMTNDQIDIIKELKNHIYINKDSNPYIITGNLLTQSIITNGKYIYGRDYIKSNDWTFAENNLYDIFYTPEYLGDSLSKNPDYENMKKYIDEIGIDYIVVDKEVEMFDKTTNDYNFLYYKVNELCDIYPVYENKRYALYSFD